MIKILTNKIKNTRNFSNIHKYQKSTTSPWLLLNERESVFQFTSPTLKKENFFSFYKNPSCYAGFDPTANSLHLGNLLQIIILIRLSLINISPIFVIGGATGLIGDPSGKKTDRIMLSKETLNENIQKITENLNSVVNNIYNYLILNKNQLCLNETQILKNDVRNFF